MHWSYVFLALTKRNEISDDKLEQLERLRSEDTPRRLMITHTIESYWIPSQKKTKSKLQIKKICQNFKFLNFETGITRYTPSEVASLDVQIWNGSDEYCWRYRADTILSTDGQTDRRTDWQTDKVIPVYNNNNNNNLIFVQLDMLFITRVLNKYANFWQIILTLNMLNCLKNYKRCIHLWNRILDLAGPK